MKFIDYFAMDEEYKKIFAINPEEMYLKLKNRMKNEDEININFKTWLESNIQKIPQNILKDLFTLLYDNVNKIKGIRPIIVGYLNVNGKNIKVVVDDVKYGEFDPDNNILYVSYIENNGVVDLDQMRRLMNHEVGHAIGKWKGTTQEYKDIFKNNAEYMTDAQKEIYFTEPVEFDAICSEMESEIRSTIEINNNKERVIKLLEDWLKNDKLLIFIGKEILNIWRKHPLLYRKLKLRIFKLYKELKLK